jgi:hypothetical protein
MYYPKSQVKTNLFSNNNFAILATGELYTGPYWQNSLGKYYTGTTPQDLPSREIIPSNSNPGNPSGNSNVTNREPLLYNEFLTTSDDVVTYNSLTGNPEVIFSLIPPYFATLPTQQDYQNGEFRRYFCKKENEIIYIEISKTTYDLIIVKSPDILWQLYFPFNLSWQITGTQEQVARTNKNIVDLTSQRLRLPRFGDYLNNNYTKYFKFPNISNLYTSGSEFKTSDGQNYIGFYHIHDNTGPMVGKTHTREPHGLLFPINEAIISEVTTRYSNQPIMSTTGSININMGTPSGGGGGY